MVNKFYQSSLLDEEWEIIKNLFPQRKSSRGRPPKFGIRQVLDAIFYVLRCGCPWRMLPQEFPPWKTVYHYFRIWQIIGLFQKINDVLRTKIRKSHNKAEKPTAAIIDSQSVKTTEVGGTRGYDAGKKIKGRKRHIVVDTLGMILAVYVHSAGVQDRDGAKIILQKVFLLFSSLLLVWADGGYAGKLVEWVKEYFSKTLEIVKRSDDVKGFKVLPKRWIVERTFGWIGRNRRMSKDYEVLERTEENWIYLSMIRLMLRRLSKKAAN